MSTPKWVIQFEQDDKTTIYLQSYPGVSERYPSGGTPPTFTQHPEVACAFDSEEAAQSVRQGDERLKSGKIAEVGHAV